MESEGLGTAEPRLYTVDDLAEMLQINSQAVYVLMKKERWPHSKYGTRIRFEPADIEAIRAMHRVAPPEKYARSTKIGTEMSRRRSHAYNVRNGLVES